MRRVILTVLVVLVTAGSAAGDAKQAKALNLKGLKQLKAKKYEAAQATFAKAVAADPTMVVAHYNLASAAALNREVDVVLEQIRWLKQSSDPAALARLTKIKSDLDFRYIAGNPAFRESAGLPEVKGMKAEILLEYGGAWSGVDQGFGNTWHEYIFAANGTYKNRSYYGEQGDLMKTTGKWKIVGDTLVIGTNEPMAWVTCGERTMMPAPEDGLCLADEQNELSRGPN
jgi:tetratricopeptide (TPR) repeat protein